METPNRCPARRLLLSGDEAVALAALDAGVHLGTGYPGTPSTEILEAFAALGGHAQWAPNEKVALEVSIGVAFAGGRALATMKHVGLNVAADPLFTVAYTGVTGALVIVSADDPGMASSQNEQDNRRYAVAAGVPMFEPADSQEAYDFTLRAIEVSERWGLPVLLRITTRVCHSKSVVATPGYPAPPPRVPAFERDIAARVMIPAYARPAHRRLAAEARRNRPLERSRRTHRDGRGRPRAGRHRDRHLLSTRARSAASGQRLQAGHDVSFADRADARIRRAPAAAWWWKRATRTWPMRRAPPASPGRSRAGSFPLWRAQRRPRAAHGRA
jgi:TPP-dependent indolepyruvate ferredoxin oxidoreductase alpha subunit